MSVAVQLGPRASLAELLAIPEEQRFHEIVDGELVRKAMPSGPHGRAQRVLGGRIGAPYDRRPGGRLPGGWWTTTETEVQFAEDQVYRPDVVGWLRERLPELPRTTPISVRPDWVCEVLSPSTARLDRVKKMRVYQRCGVPHYWMVDPEDQMLTVYRWTPEGYLLILTAERGERVRAEPFGEVELEMDALFGDEAT
ncbi:hypothetical protein BE21_01430 [Sorangium cellulosum]|uniref:Putative restriction endonuclease domain-containing protein n=1 Tax=Sorangium cellulosum TaxID=56 RepID=A0A150TYK6_SORCE|nr:hypothetical protein BE21_01430 [Sorangium cellulosum]